MPVEIIDTPVNVTRFLPKLGSVTTIIRYITRGAPNGSKHVKLPEVKAIKAAGKKLAIVHETYGDFAHAGRGGISANDGAADGKYARQVMPRLGAPSGACVYFAVDVDANASQIRNNVLPYFKNIAAAFADGEYRVGVYGCGSVCKAVVAAGHAELGWLSNAKGWSGYAAFKPDCVLLQLPPTRVAGGLDIDPNVAQTEDWGQFEPFADDASMATDPDPDVTATATEPTRMASGEDFANANTLPDDLKTAAGLDFVPSSVKGLARSKIAWLTGILGGGGAASTLTSDPATAGLLMHLLEKPAFWIAIGALAVAGTVLYYRWKDHGRGAQ